MLPFRARHGRCIASASEVAPQPDMALDRTAWGCLGALLSAPSCIADMSRLAALLLLIAASCSAFSLAPPARVQGVVSARADVVMAAKAPAKKVVKKVVKKAAPKPAPKPKAVKKAAPKPAPKPKPVQKKKAAPKPKPKPVPTSSPFKDLFSLSAVGGAQVCAMRNARDGRTQRRHAEQCDVRALRRETCATPVPGIRQLRLAKCDRSSATESMWRWR